VTHWIKWSRVVQAAPLVEVAGGLGARRSSAWAIRGLELGDLQRLFGVHDEMYDCHPVREEQVDALERATGATLDLDRYDYFVEADAV
jgi:hypothetical protein